VIRVSSPIASCPVVGLQWWRESVEYCNTVTVMGRLPLGRHVALPVSIALVLLLGLAGVWAGHQSGSTAESTHRQDRLSLQLTLAGLTGQFAQVGAAEIRDIVETQTRAGVPAWSGAPGDETDATRLRQVADGSRALSAGALLVTGPGSPSAIYAPEGRVLPAPSEPGWAPLRASVSAGRGTVPVSGVLLAGDVPVTAIGVPVQLRSGRTALLIGLSDLRSGPLQRYVAGLPKDDGRMGYVVDGSGRVIAGPRADEVGRPLRWPRILTKATHGGTGIGDVTEGRTSYTASYAPAGSTGWIALTVQETERFVGPLRRSAQRAQWTMVLFLMLAGGCLVWLHRSRERALREAALTDELTGLLNRRGWYAVAAHEIERARRAGEPRGMLFVDIDGLKQINDVLGHREGDRAISDAAEVLRRCARSVDILGRLGGDEFVLMLGERGEADVVRRRVLDALEQHNQLSGSRFELRMSIGAEVWDADDGSALDELVRRADAQMYADKAAHPHRNEGLVRQGAGR
jgi:diguanylate cyclase (GGDEF)-like protein